MTDRDTSERDATVSPAGSTPGDDDAIDRRPDDQTDGSAESNRDSEASSDSEAVAETGESESVTEYDENEGVEDIVDEYDTYGGDVEPIEESGGADDEEIEGEMRWFILKVQSNRENSICDALIRQVKMAGLEKYFGEIIVPTEDVAEYKNGKRRIVKRKLYPGYIVVHMVLSEETWFVVRETPGIGDFTGAAGKPTPMLPEEVERIVKAAHPEEDGAEAVKTAIPFKLGDRVRIKEGTFENFEGDVEGIDEANGRVTVMINIFGRSTPVELEHWQIEQV
jgi:transcriptional antiterminator NusG